MKSKIIICILLNFTLISQAGQIFSDDFDDGDMDGWSPKQGGWAVSGGDDKYLKSNSNPYSVIWDQGSFGVDQKIQVDAYFDLDSGVDNKIAHLRLRTGENSGVSQPFWDTGYLVDVQPSQVLILNTHTNGNPVILSSYYDGSSPITEDGWYTLNLEVSGAGSDTHFKFSINDTVYIDEYYNNTISALDSGYAGLGRLIKYDNFQSSVDVVPEPATLLLSAVGVGCVRLLRRRRAI